jgi:gliding-associated putative ABC transporter substrate-binding component GldG
MDFKKYYTGIALIFGIIIFLNLISNDIFFRLDFTENHQYTLSKATKDLLKNLDEPVTITAYFSNNMPPNIENVRRDFKDLLIEYANRANGKLIYQIKDPNEKEDIEKEALQNGIQPVLINVREKDQIKQQKAYLGAVVKIGDRKETIPFVQPGSPLEYMLSSAIKKISVKDKPVIGIISGHGEADLNEMFQAKANLEVLYNLKTINLNDSTKIPDNIKTLAIIRPQDSLSSKQLKILDDFLSNGGNIFIAINRVKGNLQTLYASEQHTMLEKWLKKKGIIIEPSLIADTKCGSVTVQQQQGMFRYMTQIKFPYLPIISKFADHPAVKGLEAVILAFASPVKYVGDSTIKYIPLAFSSEKSTATPAPFMFNIQKQWTDADFNKKNIPVAAAFTGNLAKNGKAKMIVIGNADFAINGKNSRQQIQQDNVSLLVNSIDWLSDDTGLIELRTKGITLRPIDELDDSTKTLLKYLNFLLPIILIVIYGIIRYQRNKNIRIKRMEENYE